MGNSVAECWPNITSGTCGITALADPGKPPFKFGYGAQALAFRPEAYFTEKDLVAIERFAQFAAVAAREAIGQSGLTFDGELAERTAVITGTSVGGQFAEEEGYQRLYIERNPRVSPMIIPRTMGNAGASRISMEFRISGPAFTISTACSSSNHAIGQAFALVKSGSVHAAIAGGSEAVFSEGLLRAWEAMRVVSPDVCRPFSLDRKGLSLGEGAGMLVLENWEHARARGAAILAEVVGFGMSSDAHHLTQPCVEGPARAMRWALEDARVDPGVVGYINAHGTGTQANDPTEASAIHSVFGPAADTIPVSSTKSMHGHTLGAAGAIEAVITVLTLRDGILPPTANFTTLDPACRLNVIANQAQESRPDYALSNTFAFGGLNASLVLKRNG